MTILVVVAVLLLFAFGKELWTVLFGLILFLVAVSLASPIEIIFGSFSLANAIALGLYVTAVLNIWAAIGTLRERIFG